MKTVEKTSTHTLKRNADGVAQTKAPVNTVPRRTGPGGNEGGTSPLFPAQPGLTCLLTLTQPSATARLAATATAASPPMRLPAAAPVAASVPVAVAVRDPLPI